MENVISLIGTPQDQRIYYVLLYTFIWYNLSTVRFLAIWLDRKPDQQTKDFTIH